MTQSRKRFLIQIFHSREKKKENLKEHNSLLILLSLLPLLLLFILYSLSLLTHISSINCLLRLSVLSLLPFSASFSLPPSLPKGAATSATTTTAARFILFSASSGTCVCVSPSFPSSRLFHLSPSLLSCPSLIPLVDLPCSTVL